MSLPRINKPDEATPYVDSAPADTSFTTGIAMLHDSGAAIEVIYSGLDAADGTIRLKASLSNDVNKARNLTDYASTMTTANSSILFNVSKIQYPYLHVVYDAGSNSTGAITVDVTRKQTS